MAGTFSVTCFGSGNGTSGDPVYEYMRCIGHRLAIAGCTVVTGGYGGSGMEAPVLGARYAAGRTIGYTLACRGKAPNQYLSHEHRVGERTSFSIDPPEMQYCRRLGRLLASDGFIAELSDLTPGTPIEVLSVMNMNMKGFWTTRRPLAIIVDERDHRMRAAIGALQLSFGAFEDDRTKVFPMNGTEGDLVSWLVDAMRANREDIAA